MTDAAAGPLREASRLARHVWRVDGRRFAGALALMILASLTEGISVILLVPLLRLIGPGDRLPPLRVPGPLRAVLSPTIAVNLAPVLIAFVLVTAVRALLVRAKDVRTADLLYDFLNRLRSSVFDAIARARWELLLRLRLADLTHAVTADADRVHVAVAQMLGLLQSVVLVCAYLAVSLFLSPALTILAAAFGVVGLLALTPTRRRASRVGESLSRRRQDQYRTVSEFLGGLKVAKSLNAEPVYVDALAGTLAEIRTATVAFVRAYTTGNTIFQIVGAAGVASFIYASIRVFGTPPSDLIVMLLLFVRVVPRLTALHTNVQDIALNVHAFTIMDDLRRRCEAARETAGTGTAPGPNGAMHVAFDQVRFTYPESGGRNVLDDVSFELRPGAITTVVGPSGGGKSTLADLVLRLLDPSGGEIRVDGAPLAAMDRVAWRDRIAYVQQDTFLAHARLAENFRLAAPDATPEAMWGALTAAGADEFVRALPDGLDTIVGERGVRLSGGERQRVALARALLRRPSLLVLDEATSSLDWDNRALVIRTVAALRGRMTIVAFDHHYGMAAIADHVVVLADGRVAVSGGRDELLAGPNGYLRAMRDQSPRARSDGGSEDPHGRTPSEIEAFRTDIVRTPIAR